MYTYVIVFRNYYLAPLCLPSANILVFYFLPWKETQSWRNRILLSRSLTSFMTSSKSLNFSNLLFATRYVNFFAAMRLLFFQFSVIGEFIYLSNTFKAYTVCQQAMYEMLAKHHGSALRELYYMGKRGDSLNNY